jgi:hypothetical protein
VLFSVIRSSNARAISFSLSEFEGNDRSFFDVVCGERRSLVVRKDFSLSTVWWFCFFTGRQKVHNMFDDVSERYYTIDCRL